MGEKDTTIRNAVIITVLAAGAAWGGAVVYKNLKEEGAVATRGTTPGLTFEPTPDGNFFSPLTPQPPEKQPPSQEFGAPTTTDCATVNNPRSIGYDPNLPTIPNAFRAIMQAGDPTVVEKGPYDFTPGEAGIKIRQHLGLNPNRQVIDNLGGFNPKVNPVHSGDEICVVSGSEYNGRGSLPEKQGLASRPGGVIYKAVRSENRTLAIKGMNIQARLRSKTNL